MKHESLPLAMLGFVLMVVGCVACIILTYAPLEIHARSMREAHGQMMAAYWPWQLFGAVTVVGGYSLVCRYLKD